MTAIQLAEAWGGHPEDHMHRKGGILWAARRIVYQKALARAQENKSKMGK